jgi:glycosyltransferase involved in cell wall biosynthesis
MEATHPPIRGGSRQSARQTAPNRAATTMSLVLPAYNEEDTIGQAIGEAERALAAITADYEIIVVEDGCTDRTVEIVAREATRNPRVRLIRHPRNLGYGAALRNGFQAARMELVAFTDSDCQFDLLELGDMLPLTRTADVVCGYRVGRKDPALRLFYSWGYNQLVRLLLGSPVRDIDCALKIFQRRHLPYILPEHDNFFANTVMLTKARRQGLSIAEIGVRHRPRAGGQSKVSLWDVPRTLSVLLPFWWSRVVLGRNGPEPVFTLSADVGTNGSREQDKRAA